MPVPCSYEVPLDPRRGRYDFNVLNTRASAGTSFADDLAEWFSASVTIPGVKAAYAVAKPTLPFRLLQSVCCNRSFLDSVCFLSSSPLF